MLVKLSVPFSVVEAFISDIRAARYHRQGLSQSIRSTPIRRIATDEAHNFAIKH
jgi:hypothetical protein